MAFQSFVSENYLKSFAPLNTNIDVQEILPHLQSTELIFARELLGKDLYDDLKTKYIAQTLSPIEIDLVTLLKESIAYRCSEQAIPFISTKIRNSGVNKVRGENFEAASLAEVKYLRDELKNRAEYFDQRVINFICNYKASFPLYRFSNLNDPSPSGDMNGFDSDIYIGPDDNLRTGRYYYGTNKTP